MGVVRQPNWYTLKYFLLTILIGSIIFWMAAVCLEDV